MLNDRLWTMIELRKKKMVNNEYPMQMQKEKHYVRIFFQIGFDIFLLYIFSKDDWQQMIIVLAYSMNKIWLQFTNFF